MASNPRLIVLKNRSDFLYILKNGQRVRPCDWLLMNFVANRDGVMRCGWTLPRQIGSAVVRNRLKRWARVYFRQILLSGEVVPVDLNLVFRKAPPNTYKQLQYDEFAGILDKGWRQIQRRFSDRSPSAHRNVPDRGNNPSGGRLPV